MPHTLRVWEQRYQAFNPQRSDSGTRLYTEEDLRKAVALAKLLERGYTISQVAKKELSELEEMVDELGKNMESTNSMAKEKTKKLLSYLADYKIDLVAKELQHLRVSISVRDFIFDIVLPTLQEIGRLCHLGKYSVSQEHIMSTIIRAELSQIFLPNNLDHAFTAALATPEGNLHELSIIIADLLIRNHRGGSHYLGSAHPPVCLGKALNAMNCDYLVLGAVSSDHWVYEKQMVGYLKKIDKALDKKITVILGGGTELDFPNFKNISKVIVMNSFEKLEKYIQSLGVSHHEK
jgi:DNA-binding transcriptional MerR regulator